MGEALETKDWKRQVEDFVSALTGCPYLDNDPKKWNMMIFSDDIRWCKENRQAMGLDVFGKVIFVEGNDVDGKNYIDLQLMSMCEGVILSNSAFSYLAALLNTTKRIVSNSTMREI